MFHIFNKEKDIYGTEFVSFPPKQIVRGFN